MVDERWRGVVNEQRRVVQTRNRGLDRDHYARSSVFSREGVILIFG